MTTPSISIDASEVVDLARAWREAPEMMVEELVPAMWESELLIERETKEHTPVGASGGAGLKGSIAAREPKVLADQVIGAVGTPLQYAVPVELGTKPHFPPVRALADWARQKLGLPTSEAERVGFLVALKISREGTEGAFMFRKGFESTQPQVERTFFRAATRIRDRLGERKR